MLTLTGITTCDIRFSTSHPLGGSGAAWWGIL